MNVERKTKSFDIWLQDYGQIWLGQYTTKLKRYLGEDPNFATNNKIDFIGRTENLIPDLKYALGAAGEVFDDEQITEDYNCNIQSYKRDSVSPASIDLIYKCEKEVFERFKYVKEPDYNQVPNVN
jgi:hypothetical protein